MAKPAPPDTNDVTHRRVLKIAVPIVLSNATVPLLGAVDTGVVGQLGQAAPIGAVGIGSIILSTLFWAFGFIRMGTTGLVSQARGAGETTETGALLMRGLIFGVVAGLMLIAGQFLIFAGAFAISPASQEVETLAESYMAIRIWGAPATISLYALTGWLIAMERTRSVMVLQFWMNGLNIVLDLVFVLSWGWGIEGVAIATLIAEWTAVILGVALCKGAFVGEHWRNWARVFDPARLRRMLSVNFDIMIRSVLLMLSFTSFLFLGAGLGDVTLAANQILMQFLSIIAFSLDGFALSAEALVGAAVGAGSSSRLRKTVVIHFQWGYGGAIVMGLLVFVFGPWLIDLMSASPEVREETRVYLIWVAVASVLSITSWMLDGVFIGATWTREMRRAMIVSVAIYFLALAFLLPAYGNHGLWGALIVLNIVRGVTLGVVYPKLAARVGQPNTTSQSQDF